MKILTINRSGLLLTANTYIIPAQGSKNVPVAVTNDNDEYTNYIILPKVGYFVNGIPKAIEAEFKNGKFEIPAEAFEHFGMLSIALELTDNEDANHVEITKEIMFQVTTAPRGTIVLPVDEDTWQAVVESFVEQYLGSNVPSFEYMQENYLAKTAAATDDERTMSGNLNLANGIVINAKDANGNIKPLIQLIGSNVRVGNSNNVMEIYSNSRPVIVVNSSNENLCYLSDLESINSSIDNLKKVTNELESLSNNAVYYQE